MHMRRTPTLALLLALGATTPLAAQYPDWNRAHPIPAPDGSWSVGTRVARIVDSTRPASQHLRVRPIIAQFWYPTTDSTGTRAPYVPESAMVDTMLARDYQGLLASITRTWKTLPTPAWLDAVPARPPTAAAWPTLLFSHGYGVARANYTALATALASHGYLVITLDHPLGGVMLDADGHLVAAGLDAPPYPTDPYRHLVHDWVLDALFVLDRIAAPDLPPIDTTRLGYLGHSLGGAAALDACLVDARFKACVDMDGSPFGEASAKPIGKPFLVLLSEPDHRDQPPPADSVEAKRRADFARMGRERDEEWQQIGGRNGAVPWHVVKLLGTGHFSFSDGPFQLPMQLQGVGATMAPIDMLRATEALLLDFFGHYLGGAPLVRLAPGAASGP